MSIRFPSRTGPRTVHDIDLAANRKHFRFRLNDVVFVGMLLISAGGLIYVLLH